MSKVNARFRRRIIILVLALASLVWVATDQFDIPRENVAWLLLYTTIGVVSIIVIAALVVGLWLALRKLFGSSTDEPQ